MVRCILCGNLNRETRKCKATGMTIKPADLHRDFKCDSYPNNARRKWLLKVASKEANPYFQAEILYSILGEKKK